MARQDTSGPQRSWKRSSYIVPTRIGALLTRLPHSLFSIAYEPLSIIDRPSERSPLATNSYLLFIKALRAVVHPVSANPSPDRAHDPSWGIWPYTVLKSRTICEQLPVLSRSPRKEIMMSRSRQKPDLANSTSPRHVTMAPNVGPRQISTERPSMPCMCLRARMSMLRALRVTTVVRASSIRLKEPLTFRCNRSE